ncbi:hypothetical protein TrRE_jg6493, partial [Triparma retinervis]
GDEGFCTRLFTNVHQASLYLRYLFLKNFRSPFYTVYAVFCALLSLLILWSELTMGIPVNLSPLASLLNLPGFLLETFVMLPLLYMSVAVYGSLFKVRIFGKYGLRSKKRSDGPALAFSASYLVRMQFPLCYNYLLLLHPTKTPSFLNLMSSMDTIPLFGTSFTVYAPLLTVFLCVATYLNWYGRLLKNLGVDHDDAVMYKGGTDEGEREERVREGMALMKKALRLREGRGEVGMGGGGGAGGGMGGGGGGRGGGGGGGKPRVDVIGKGGLGEIDIKPTFGRGKASKYSRLDNEL